VSHPFLKRWSLRNRNETLWRYGTVCVGVLFSLPM
jgi:hypothetical protein